MFFLYLCNSLYKDKLKKILPEFAQVHNPLDLIGDADIERYEKLKGATEIDLPESLKDFSTLLKKVEENDNNGHGFAMAAREGEVLSEDIVKKMQNLMDEEEAKSKDINEGL